MEQLDIERVNAYKWRVSEHYWLRERGLTEDQYRRVVVESSSCGNPGFCERCMGNISCEIRVLGFEVWHNKVFPDKPLPVRLSPKERKEP